MKNRNWLIISVAALYLLNASASFAHGHNHNHDHEHEHEHEELNYPGLEYKLINGLKYYKTMYDATPFKQIMQIKMGSELNNVGGYEQDTRNLSRGLPMAIRPTNELDKVWVLDSINDYLKLFKSGKVIKSISLKEMGFINDFAISKEGKFAFLNQLNGNIYLTDAEGKLENTIAGFKIANSVEFYSNDELLVDSPTSKGMVRITTDGKILGIYECDQTLSSYSSEKGIWGIEAFGTTSAKLFVRDAKFPSDKSKIKVIAEFPFKDYEDVKYNGGEIYGFDKEGNVYLGLVACNPVGVIYRDRIYKCTQDGKVLKYLDVIDNPVLSPDIARHRLACPDGRILTFTSDEVEFYSLHYYDLR